MKKIVALLLVLCILIPSVAMADIEKAKEYANEVRTIINNLPDGKTMSATVYTKVLGLTMSAREEFASELMKSFASILSVYFLIKDESATTSINTISTLSERTFKPSDDLYTAVTKEASDNYANYKFSFSAIQNYINYILDYCEQNEYLQVTLLESLY